MPVLTLAIPAKTLTRAPVRAVLELDLPVLRAGVAKFPTACAYLVGVRVLDRSSQIVPYGTGWLIGESEAVGFELPGAQRLHGPPYRLTFEGYNSDVRWPHTIQFSVEMGA
jgi:hypothetical protein